MSLAEIAAALRAYPPIRRKFSIPPVVQYLRDHAFQPPHVIKSYGEDSALLDITGTATQVVFTTDEIDPAFARASPWGAGYSAILVGAEDIYACGAHPKAAAINIAYHTASDRDEILAGLTTASQRFQIPIVRGHTHELARDNAVSASIVGTVSREDYVSAGGARVPGRLGLVFDPDGREARVNPLYWDTTTFRDSTAVLERHAIVPRLARAHLLFASKDVSNGGLVGTALQMAEYSGVGFHVQLDALTLPAGVSPAGCETGSLLLKWLKMYLTCAFVVCFHPDHEQDIRETCHEARLDFQSFGTAIPEKKIILARHDKEVTLFDFHDESLTLPNSDE